MKTTGLLALVLLVVALVHAPALGGELVYDDLLLVGQNPALHSLARLPEALGAAYWSFLDADSAARIGYWRPLTTLALYAGQLVGGGEPWGFHTVSLSLHLAATALVFALARRLAGNAWVGLAAALLFGLHPVQVEAVAWISAVNDPLQAVCVLAGLVAFLGWRERGSEGVPTFTCACLALALLAKESGAALVPLALVLDLARGTRRAQLARAYVPLVLVGGGYWLTRALVFGHWAGGFDRVTSHLYLGAVRAVTIRAELLGGALELLAWPAQLNLFREVRPEVPTADPVVVRAFLWILAWTALVALAAMKRAPRVLAAALLVPAALAPALIRFESIGRFPLSDRFLYLSVAGVALLGALALARLPRLAGALVLGVLAVVLGMRSQARAGFWKDELTLFRQSVAASPQSLYVHWGLGRVLLDQYRATRDPAVLEQAHEAFLMTQDLGSPPDGAKVPTSRLVTPHDLLQANLGVGWYYFLCALDRPGECSFDEAEMVFRATAERATKGPFGSARAYAMTGLGLALLYQDELDEAEATLLEATELFPGMREAWFNLGQVARRRGDYGQAIEYFRRALDITPDDLQSQIGLGEALVQTDQGGEARRVLSRALAAAPENPELMMHLGALHGREGNPSKALEWLDKALNIDGRMGNAHLLRGKALVQLGDARRAIGAFQEACRYMPNSFEAHYNLGVLLIQNGLTEDGQGFLRRALDIDPTGPHAGAIHEALERLEESEG
jgi:tetratricopeptide (TPR) repeat protein